MVETSGMVQGRRHEHDVIFIQAKLQVELFLAEYDVAVGQHHAFITSGCSRCAQYQRHFQPVH